MLLEELLTTIWNTDMAATMERLDEYRTHNGQFATRLLSFLSVMFSAQVCGNFTALALSGAKIVYGHH
jgi:hypothetical protein